MSNKQQKKIRQLYRRDLQDKAEALGKALGNCMKPKPRWVPWAVWMWGLGIFIKIKPSKK